MAGKNPRTEQAIKEHCADPALRKLVAAGCEERMLINALSMMRNCDDSWKSLVGQAWPGFRGDPKKRLQGSIKTIRNCAAEIRRLESTLLWEQMVAARSRHSPAGYQVVLFSQELQSYADTWNDVISKIGPKTHPFQSEGKAVLVAYVHKATGGYHDEEVSALIAAVTDKPCDAHALLQWRKDNKELIDLQEAELLRQPNRPESAG